ncbi:MAG: anaerobic sulfatase maturase [Planctomycetota bacterium]|jgi:uncharacterized protein
MQPFTLLIKPSGSDCNLDCKYCFYKCRSPEIGQGRQRMSDEILEKLVKDYMKLRFDHAGFAWQGGEPTLMGLDFYKKAVELQKKYGGPGQTVSNALQTNAILLDDDWCDFLRDNKFLVGISIDGPKEFHDYYRVDHSGRGTYDKVMRAIENCRRHNVEFNLLVLLNNKNADHPDELFDFLVALGTRYLQFIPCVEQDPATGQIADFSVTPHQYGEFTCRIFDRWYEYGPKKLSIRDFDSILSFCLTGRNTICTFDRQCSQYVVVEYTGDCFPCDFFVEPEWRLGNIFETPIEKLAASDKKRNFARAKKNLCNKCLLCSHLALCRGGCMKDKLATPCHSERSEESPVRSDKLDVNKETYFCESYKRFFKYTMPRFMQIAAQISSDSNTPKRPFV